MAICCDRDFHARRSLCFTRSIRITVMGTTHDAGQPMRQVAVRGKSAFELQTRNRRLGRYVALGILVGVGSGLIDWSQQNLVHVLALVILNISLGLGMFVWVPAQIVANLREVAEVRAGYTTLRDAHQDVQEVEPGTFRLVRLAGEPFITNQQREERLRGTPTQTTDETRTRYAAPGKPGIPTSRGQKIVAIFGIAALLASLYFRLV